MYRFEILTEYISAYIHWFNGLRVYLSDKSSKNIVRKLNAFDQGFQDLFISVVLKIIDTFFE